MAGWRARAQDIAEQLEFAPPDSEEDQRALEYLRLVSVCLLAVHLVLEHVIARELAGAPMWRRVSAAPKPEGFEVAAARPIFGVPILDPG